MDTEKYKTLMKESEEDRSKKKSVFMTERPAGLACSTFVTGV